MGLSTFLNDRYTWSNPDNVAVSRVLVLVSGEFLQELELSCPALQLQFVQIIDILLTH